MSSQTSCNVKIMRNIAEQRGVKAAGVVSNRQLKRFSFACKQCGKVVNVETDTAREFVGLCFDCLMKH